MHLGICPPAKRLIFPYIQSNKSNMSSVHDILKIHHSFISKEIRVICSSYLYLEIYSFDCSLTWTSESLLEKCLWLYFAVLAMTELAVFTPRYSESSVASFFNKFTFTSFNSRWISLSYWISNSYLTMFLFI